MSFNILFVLFPDFEERDFVGTYRRSRPQRNSQGVEAAHGYTKALYS